MVETNRYAEKVLDEIIIKRNSRFKEWKPTDFDEMKLFLGLLIQIGMLNLPRLSDYWSTDPLFKTYTWRKTMSRNIFFLLLRLWHFGIPCANERLSKIAFFMNHLNETMKRIYCPSENISLDWCYSDGRLIFRQHIKNKKHKHGVKFYELCEPSGLILRSLICSGLPYPDIHDLGQTGVIVLKLMEFFLGKGCTVFAVFTRFTILSN